MLNALQPTVKILALFLALTTRILSKQFGITYHKEAAESIGKQAFWMFKGIERNSYAPIRVLYRPPKAKNPNFKPIGDGFGFLLYMRDIHISQGNTRINRPPAICRGPVYTFFKELSFPARFFKNSPQKRQAIAESSAHKQVEGRVTGPGGNGTLLHSIAVKLAVKTCIVKNFQT